MHKCAWLSEALNIVSHSKIFSVSFCRHDSWLCWLSA